MLINQQGETVATRLFFQIFFTLKISEHRGWKRTRQHLEFERPMKAFSLQRPRTHKCQDTHLCGEEGINIIPGSKLGTSSQGCQHILFIWDLKSRNQENVRGNTNASVKCFDMLEKCLCLLLLILSFKVNGRSGRQTPLSSQATPPYTAALEFSFTDTNSQPWTHTGLPRHIHSMQHPDATLQKSHGKATLNVFFRLMGLLKVPQDDRGKETSMTAPNAPTFFSIILLFIVNHLNPEISL